MVVLVDTCHTAGMRVEEPGGPDAATVNPERPVYQVNIYTRLSEPVNVPEESRSFVVSEWKLHETDVREVLAWAQENAGGAPYTVAVAAVDEGDGADLIHLWGEDPTRVYTSRKPYLLAPGVLVDP